MFAEKHGSLTFSESIRVLATEQSQAESYAGLLNKVAKPDIAKYARGILLYADAKAEFDGLIEEMKSGLNRGKSQEASPEFDRVLKNAVDRRVAFTSYVSETIVGDDGEKSITVTVATAVALFPLLRKAGKTIWQEYRKVSDQRKRDIIDQLDGLKWKSFHEIPGSK